MTARENDIALQLNAFRNNLAQALSNCEADIFPQVKLSQILITFDCTFYCLLFTALIQRIGGGNVFTGACPSTRKGVPQSLVPGPFRGGTPVRPVVWGGGTPVRS